VGRFASLFSIVAAFVVIHCSSSSDDEDRVCDPGRQVTCACQSGNNGVQSCKSDGSGYTTCVCDDAGTAGTGGSATGGTGGSSGAATGGSGGTGGSAGDASTTCGPGEATNISGSCDLVTQDCAAGLTCRVEQTDSGAYQSTCLDLGNGPKKLGETCASHSECEAKLVCALSKCTRPCCFAAEAFLCGANGACDLSINYGSSFVQVCTFSASCTPWTNDCPPGPESDCHIGAGGKLKCSFPNYELDGGSTLGQPCQFLNDCQDSQQCDFSSGGSGVCRWLCKASATGAPDAGTVGGAPGSGGCPTGETCVPYTNPSWLGVCQP
jgi:hypothetical protein